MLTLNIFEKALLIQVVRFIVTNSYFRHCFTRPLPLHPRFPRQYLSIFFLLHTYSHSTNCFALTPFYFCSIIFLFYFFKWSPNKNSFLLYKLGINGFWHFQNDKLAFCIRCKQLIDTLRWTDKQFLF